MIDYYKEYIKQSAMGKKIREMIQLNTKSNNSLGDLLTPDQFARITSGVSISDPNRKIESATHFVSEVSSAYANNQKNKFSSFGSTVPPPTNNNIALDKPTFWQNARNGISSAYSKVKDFFDIDLSNVSDNADAISMPIATGSGLAVTAFIQNTNSYDSETGKVVPLDKTKSGINRTYDRENPNRKGFYSFYDDRNYVWAKTNNVVIPHGWVGDTSNKTQKLNSDGIIVVATGSRDFDNKENIRKTFEGILESQGNIKYIAVGDWKDGADKMIVEVAGDMGILVKQFIVPPGAWDSWKLDKNDNPVNSTLSPSEPVYKVAGPVRNSIMIADSIDKAGGITPDKIIGVGFFQNGSANSGTTDAYSKMMAYGLDIWNVGNQTVPEKVNVSGEVAVSMTPKQLTNLINTIPGKINVKSTPSNIKANIEMKYDLKTFNLIPTTEKAIVYRDSKTGVIGIPSDQVEQPSINDEKQNDINENRAIKSSDFMQGLMNSPEVNVRRTVDLPPLGETPEEYWKRKYGY